MDLLTMILACSLYPDNSIPNAVVMLGSEKNPLAVSTLYPDGKKQVSTTFKTPQQAAKYTLNQMNKGYSVEIGLMQIPSRWIPKMREKGTTLEQLFRPCKNIVTATDILNHAALHCAGQSNEKICQLSVYKTGDDIQSSEYAQQILDYAAAHPLSLNPQNTALGTIINDVSDPSKPAELPDPTFSGGEPDKPN